MTTALVQPLPGIGDMVWHVAHIRAISAWAGGPVSVITKPRSLADQLFADEPAVRDVHFIDMNPHGRRGRHDGVLGFWRLVQLFRAGGWRSVVFLHHSRTLAMAAWLAGIKDRRGYGWGSQRPFLSRGPFLPKSIGKRHQLKRATAWVRAAGIPFDDDEPSLTRAKRDSGQVCAAFGLAQPFVAVGIGSSEVLRQWGTDKFAALVAALLAAGWRQVVLVGGQEDQASATRIIAANKAAPGLVTPILGAKLSAVIAVLAEASFYVGNNTGVMNIAGALGIPTFALFGTTPIFDHGRTIYPITAEDTGRHDGMVRVGVEQALDVITAKRGGLAP